MVSASNLHPVCTSRLESESKASMSPDSSTSGAPLFTSSLPPTSLAAGKAAQTGNNNSGGGGSGVRVRIKGEAIDIAVGPYHGAVVTESEQVYTWGYNINCSTLGFKGADNVREMSKADPHYDMAGQLGRGDLYVATAGRVRELPSKALMVACGAVHTACLTVDGLYMWGLNDEGQLGLPPSEARLLSLPRLISNARATFVSVACGAHHTVALTNNGRVFAWGLNSNGQVSPDRQRAFVDTPTKVNGIERAQQIACGNVHAAALTSNGSCYTWGGNSHGQLGTERSDFDTPHMVVPLARTAFLTSVACGTHMTAVTDDMGDVYVWGRLMAAGMIDHQTTPRRLECVNHLYVTSVACGTTHLALLVHRELTSRLKHFMRAKVFNVDAPLNFRSIYVPRTWTELKRVVCELLFIDPKKFNNGDIRTLGDFLNRVARPIAVSGPHSASAAATVAARIRFGSHNWVGQRSQGHVLTRVLPDADTRQSVLSPGRSTAKALLRVREGELTRKISALKIGGGVGAGAGVGVSAPSGGGGRFATIGPSSRSSGNLSSFGQVDVSAYVADRDLQDRRRKILSILDADSTTFDVMLQAMLQRRVVESELPPLMRAVSSKRAISSVKRAIEEEAKVVEALASPKKSNGALDDPMNTARSNSTKSITANTYTAAAAAATTTTTTSTIINDDDDDDDDDGDEEDDEDNDEDDDDLDFTDETDESSSYDDEVGAGQKRRQLRGGIDRSVTRTLSGSSMTVHSTATPSGAASIRTLSGSGEAHKVLASSDEAQKMHSSQRAPLPVIREQDDATSKNDIVNSYAAIIEGSLSKKTSARSGGVTPEDRSAGSPLSDDSDDSDSASDDSDSSDSSSSSSSSSSAPTTRAGGAVWKTKMLPTAATAAAAAAPAVAAAPAAVARALPVAAQVDVSSYSAVIEDDAVEAPVVAQAKAQRGKSGARGKVKRVLSGEAGGGCDDDDYSLQWNRRFQSTLRAIRTAQGPEERVACYSELSSLVTDFIYLAETYARIIISEAYMPIERKTIKPSKKFGGVAGGDKYIVHGILFKFANNSQGLYPNDEAASKVAGHDLKGLRTYFNCGIPALHFPLMALVDYSGFRMSCMSVLPITKDTLIYGSCDGALTVAAEPSIGALIAQAARKINIKPHMAGRRKAVEIWSPVDVEGHCGVDGKFYLIDYSRVMPPEKPVKGLRSAHMFRLLRPEYVKQYHTPLCSDACSRFVPEAEVHEHNEEVAEATAVLKDEVIPAVAMDLQTLRHGWDFSLQSVLHSRGANLRYLGLLRSHVRDPELRDLILVEMVARVVKTELREKMRAVLQQSVLPLEDPRRQAVISHLNVVFGNSDQARLYWGEHLKTRLMDKFERALSAEELKPTYDLKQSLCKDGGMESKLFLRVQQIMGLKFIPSVMREFSKPSTSGDADVFNSYTPFDETDMEELGCRVKHLNIVERALGYILKTKARKHGIDPNARRRLLKQAMSKFDAALESDPDNKGTLRNYSDVLAMNGEYERADFFYRRALEVDPDDTSTLFAYAVFLEQIHRLAEAEAFFVRCLEIDQFNDHCLQAYGYFIEEKLHDSDVAEQFYKLASRVRQAKLRLNQASQGIEATGELFEH
jgi:tetratricopeptide (TPR) repeat protein